MDKMTSADAEAIRVLEGLPPADALEVARLIIREVVIGDSLDEWREGVAAIIAGLPVGESDDPESPINGYLAVDVARALGSEAAQQWYRFTVLVTKIAGARG